MSNNCTYAKVSWQEYLNLLILYPLIIIYMMVSNLLTGPQPIPDPKKNKPSILFAGCAFLYPYHIGVIKYLIENYDLEDVTYQGLSSACYPLVSWIGNGIPPDKWMHKDFPGCIEYWNRCFMGFFWDTPQFLQELWASSLKPDAYKKASEGNLVVNLTKVSWTPPFVQQMRVSEFRSNQDLIDCIVASGHIPGMFGFIPTRFRGSLCIDGAVACSYPVKDTQTIVVDAYGYGQSSWRSILGNTKQTADIYPSKRYGFFEMNGLFGVPEMSRCDEMVKDGYRDAAAADDIFMSRGWVKKRICKVSEGS